MLLKSVAHLKLGSLTNKQYLLIYNEFKRWKTFYPLELPKNFSFQTRKRHYEAIANLAIRGIEGDVAVPFCPLGTQKNNKIRNTELWNKSPHTTEWLIHNFGPLKNIGGVTYQRLNRGRKTSWHTHYTDRHTAYDWYNLHVPLKSNAKDICEVRMRDSIKSQRYNNGEIWIFNCWEEHRSYNLGEDRIHLVFEVYYKKIDEIVSKYRN